MPSYCPPSEDIVSPIYLHPDRQYPVPRLAQALFRHYKRRARQRNIFLLTNGTLTRSQPADYSTVSRVYFGGHVNEVTAAELTALTNAGFPSSC